MYETIALGSAAGMLLTITFITQTPHKTVEIFLAKIFPFLIGTFCLVLFFKRIGVI